MPTLNRSEINRALAKAIAYQQCGKQDQAEQWAAELICLLQCNGILKPGQSFPEIEMALKAS